MASKKQSRAGGGSKIWGPGFLKDVWPTRVSEPRKGTPTAASVLARFAIYGIEAPAALHDFLAPLDAHAPPPLHDLVPGTYAPRAGASDRTNVADALFAELAAYRPLAAEAFAGAFEIGSTGSGDVWMVAMDAFGKGNDFVYLYGHDTDVLAGPAAVDLDAFVAAQVAAAELRDVDDEDPRRAEAAKAFAKRIDPAFFDDAIMATAFEPAADNAPFLVHRARWLLTLLTETEPSALEIRSGFDREANAPIDAALLEKRKAIFSTFPATAIYTCLAAYFGGDDALAKRAADYASASTVPLVRDLGVLVQELLAGTRKRVGAVLDMPALRARVVALSLWDAPKVPEAAPEDAVLATLFQSDGYRDEDAIAAFIQKGDRSVVARMIARSLDSGDRARSAFLDILTAWRERAAIEPLLALAGEVDRFHIARSRYVALVHAAGSAEHAPILVSVLKQLAPKAGTRDSYLDDVVARAFLAAADLGARAVVDMALRASTSGANDAGRETHVSVRDAALYAVGALGDVAVIPALLERTQGREYDVAGLRWALGELGARADAATRTAVLARLDAIRIDKQTIEDSDGAVEHRSIDSLFDPDLGGQDGDIMAEIALEHARVLLGQAPDALAELVRRGLTESEDEGVHVWALLALRAHRALGAAWAAPFRASPTSLLRLLAEDCLR